MICETCCMLNHRTDMSSPLFYIAYASAPALTPASTHPGERIGAILTTIFALQGIQYRLGDNELPVKSYSTWLDNYIAISYFFLLSLLLELALVLLYVDHFSIHPAEKAPRANAAFEGVERREEDVSIDRISIGNKIDAGFAYAWLLGWILWHIHVWCKYCRWRHQPHEHADDEPVEKTERPLG